jgi:hypothetical protein
MVAIEEKLKQSEEDADKVSSNIVALDEKIKQYEEDANLISLDIVHTRLVQGLSKDNTYLRSFKDINILFSQYSANFMSF